MKFVTLSFLTVLLTATTSYADVKLDKEVEARVLEVVSRSCTLPRGASISVAKVDLEIEKIDQGVRDYHYSIVLKVLSRGYSPEWINVKASKYAISNPQFDNIEVTSIESKICR